MKSSSRGWENEAKESVEKMARAEAERDVARHNASMAHIDTNAARSVWAKVESKLARVQSALTIVEKARRKMEDKASCLADEQVSLLLELRACKDEMSAIQAEALKEKKALEEAYEEGFDVIFNYGYGCCSFAHNICGSQLEVPDGMSDTSKSLSPKFFISPPCPSGFVPSEVNSIDVSPGKETNEPKREAPATVLETDNSEAGEHLSTAEVGPGNEPVFSA